MIENSDMSNRFPSLTSLWQAHSELLQEYHQHGNTPDLLRRVELFIEQGQATGLVLDIESERATAQSLLDYWAATLYDAGYRPPTTALDEFDPLLAPELPDEKCPYVGLYSFGEENNNYFFGRSRLVTTLAEKLKSERLLVVIGSSGSGKSSLVLAGLIPALKNGAIASDEEGNPGNPNWYYLPRIVPGSKPLTNLARAIYQLKAEQEVNSEEDIETWIKQQVETLQNMPAHLVELVRSCGGRSLVVTIDQFEEIFTLCSNEKERVAFVTSLLDLTQTKDAPHTIILTMRSDFEFQVARLPDFEPYFEQALVWMTPLNIIELRQAIEEPAKMIGLKFDEGLIDRLIQEILGEPAALPLLQFTLLKLWDERNRNRITWEAYNRLGGPRLALAHSADELYENLIPEQQLTAKRILLRLVRPGGGLEVTSNRVQLKTLYQSGEAHDRVDWVLQKFLEARLLRLSDSDTTTDDSQVEVAHEALVRNWPKLVGWIEDERETIRQRLRLTEAVEKWNILGRDESALWRGVLLTEALRFTELNELETEFVQASQEAEEKEKKEKEEVYQRQLFQARELAESEAKSKKRLLALLISLSTLVIIGILGFFVYYRTNNELLAQTYLSEGYARTDLKQYEGASEKFNSALQLNPSNAEVYFALGRVYEQQKKYISATVAYSQAIQLNYEYPSFPYYGLGFVSYNLENYDEAIMYLTKSLTADSKYADAYYFRGWVYEQLGDYEQAIADYEQATEIDPTVAVGPLQLAPKLRKQIEAIKKNPNDANAYAERAELYKKYQSYEKAINDYTSAIKLDRDNPNHYAQRGFCRYYLGKYEEAITDYTQAIELNYKPLSWAFLARGDVYLRVKNYEKAIKDYQTSIKIEPDKYPAAYYNQGVAYKKLKRFEEAIADYKKALELKPDYFEAKQGLESARDAELEKLTEAIKKNPNDTDVYVKRAELYGEFQNYKEAIEDYTSAIKLDGDKSDYYALRGLSYYRLGKYKEAIDDYTQAIKLNYEPLSWAFLARGDAYLAIKDYEKAINDYTTSISKEPTKYPVVYNNRCAAYFILKRFDEAIGDCKKALELNPDYLKAKQGLENARNALKSSSQ